MKDWNIKAMSISDKIYTIITSGGNSTRFGSNKLLEKIGELSVIETTISKFLDISDVIIIPSQKEVQEHILKSKLYSKKIIFAPAGETRQQSVYSGLQMCGDNGIVLIHDGARPFISKDVILKIINETKIHKASVAGIYAIDTIKEAEDGFIIKTLNRSKIFQAHTPQAFEAGLIKKIHEKYKNDFNFTDDSSMAENFGIKVKIVEDLKSNIKITTKDDLA